MNNHQLFKDKNKTKEKFVLTPMSKYEMNIIFDLKSKKTLKYFLIKSIFSNPEKMLNQDNTLNYQIAKENIEQWFCQALNTKSVGSGNYPIDIQKNKEWGADVKMLSIKHLVMVD